MYIKTNMLYLYMKYLYININIRIWIYKCINVNILKISTACVFYILIKYTQYTTYIM